MSIIDNVRVKRAWYRLSSPNVVRSRTEIWYHQRVDIIALERYLPAVITTSTIDGVYFTLARLRNHVLAVSVILCAKRFNKLDSAKSDGDACFVLAHGMVAEQKFVKTFILQHKRV
jgi:hypothetical protein